MCFFASSHCDNAAKKQLSSQKAVSVTEERLFARWGDKHAIKWRLFGEPWADAGEATCSHINATMTRLSTFYAPLIKIKTKQLLYGMCAELSRTIWHTDCRR